VAFHHRPWKTYNKTMSVVEGHNRQLEEHTVR